MSLNNFVSVHTEYGAVKGLYGPTKLGRDHYAFQGIPYMKAPIGKLRFRAPEVPDKWTEVFDATLEIPEYFNVDFLTKTCKGQEDAGVINVFTPYLDRKLPVMAYIHGGGFQGGSSKTDMAGPDFLLQKDVVLVTFNYRLGPIGFLTLDDPELDVPGNAGLKDQTLALKWIQRNIAKFGGDAKNVTLFGLSAGGASVHYQMISELSRGLFHRAIPMSGVALNKTWAVSPKRELVYHQVYELAKKLGWNGEGGERKLLEFLEAADPRKMMEISFLELMTPENVYNDHTLFSFAPVIEPYITDGTFIPKDPVLMARDAWSNEIDCMIGGTSLEGALMLMMGGNFVDHLKTNEKFLPFELGTDRTTAKALRNGTKMKELYFAKNEITKEMIQQYYLFASDLHFWHGIYRSAVARNNSSGAGKTFLYRFDIPSLAFAELFKGQFTGAGHGADVAFLFPINIPAFGMKLPEIDSEDFDLTKKMLKIYTDFAIYGDPNGPTDKTWKPLAGPVMQCFDMTREEFKMTLLPEYQRLKVWDEIYQDSGVELY